MFYPLPPLLDAEISELERKIALAQRGYLAPGELKAHRVPFGVYEQRRSDSYMMRVRCPGGAVTPAQLRRAARLAAQYAAPVLHITTRQELQLHDLPLESVIPVMRGLLEVSLCTRGGGGNTVRNIVASPSAGTDPEEAFDVSPYVFALTGRLLAEPDSWLLPRKFKIGFFSTEADEAQAAFQDVGFAARRSGGERGFLVYLAGGLGARPAAGLRAHDFLPAGETYAVAEAVKRLFSRHGNRRNRQRNRLRFLRGEMGDDAFLDLYRRFRAEVVAEAAEPLRWPEAATAPGTLPAPVAMKGEDCERWRRRYVSPGRDGACRVLFPVPHGNLPAEQALALADFLEPLGPDSVRGTREQNLLLRHVPPSHLGNVYALLKGWNALVDSPSLLGRATVCTGASTCKLGICRPRPAMDAIAREIAASGIDRGDCDDFQLNLSGCPNGCGNHWIADLGFAGRAAHRGGRVYPAYTVVAGGRAGRGEAALARVVGEVPARRLPALVRAFIEQYLETGARFGSFRDYVRGEGCGDLERLLERFSPVPEYGADPAFYADWGELGAFSLSAHGPGECSAGLFDLIDFDLRRARACLEEPRGDASPEARAEALYQAALFSARALLITRGAEPRGEPDVFALFSAHFLESGLVEERFRAVLVAGASGDRAALQVRAGEVRELHGAVTGLYRRMDDSFRFVSGPDPGGGAAAEGEARADAPLRDLRGVGCPMNFVKVKIALDGLKPGERLGVLLDNGSPIENVPRSLEGEGHKILERAPRGDHWFLLVEKS